ncbi:hypothetical protein Daus18300_000034 [Diaporthe australafricana]|uniref:Uncharacterized protein n=1 Tax=Diaporthe australafricana TaxID=127596 RepID=A0ABR3Y6K3_9PEZI
MAQARTESRSYRLATPAMRGILDTVRLAVKSSLAASGLSWPEALEMELVWLNEAHEVAMKEAMEQSPNRAVQPDWLLSYTAAMLWVITDRRLYADGGRPDLPVEILEVPLYKDGVEPCPEHRDAIAAALVATEAQSKAQRGEDEAPELASAIEPSRATSPSRTNTVPAKAQGFIDLGNQAHEEVQQTADKTRADEMAETQKRLGLAHPQDKVASNNRVPAYRFKVADPHKRFMAYLWENHKVAERFPASDGFTCSSRPWEVMVQSSKADLFFGPEFGDRDSIICLVGGAGPAKIYSRIEDEVLFIGLTLQMNNRWARQDVGQDRDDSRHASVLNSTFLLFKQVAEWAKFVHLGVFVDMQFAQYILQCQRDRAAKMGIKNGTKGNAGAVVGDKRARDKKAAEDAEEPQTKKTAGAAAPLPAESDGKIKEVEMCKKFVENLLMNNKHGVIRAAEAVLWYDEHAPQMKHLTRAEMAKIIADWWRNDLDLGRDEQKNRGAKDFEKFVREHEAEDQAEKNDDLAEHLEDAANTQAVGEEAVVEGVPEVAESAKKAAMRTIFKRTLFGKTPAQKRQRRNSWRGAESRWD